MAADNGLELGAAAYVSDEMRAVTAEVGTPHRVIRIPVEEEYYYVAIASVAGLDAALAESGVSEGCLIGQVLPTATLSDCLSLKDAAEDGWYRGLRFLMLATEEEGEDTVDAKLGTILEVVEARLDLEEARATLAALVEALRKTGRVLQQVRERPQITPGARTRASLGDEEWANKIDKARTDVMNLIAFTMERLRPGQARLESI